MRLFLITATALVAGLALSVTAQAQTDVVFQPTNGDWNVPTNWLDPFDNTFVPEASVNEAAVINDGRLAFVQDSPFDPGEINIGTTLTQTGTVEIRSGGSLNVVVGTPVNTGETPQSGNINVGPSGSGTLDVQPGGALTSVGSLIVGGNAANLVKVGDSTGAGTATLTPNAASLTGGVTQVYSNADFTTSTLLAFGGGSTYQVEINGSGNGMIGAGTTAQLGGTLHMNFTGVSPTVGASWTVLEADSFSGTFNNLTSSVSLPFGQAFVQGMATSEGRVQANVSLEEILVLEVNRNTGAAAITQPGGNTLSIDSYYVGSDDVGSLTPAGWISLNSEGTLGSDWVPTASDANTVGELKAADSAGIGAGANVSLGQIYDPFAGDFGQLGEDLEFVYSRPSDGAIIKGIVNYTGTKVNTLLLQVDPDTGESVLRNTSETTVEIDGYHVLSDSQSLSTGGWSSLDGQDFEGSGTWLELLDTNAGLLGEFNVAAAGTQLAPGAALNLGSLYLGDATGQRDLEFEFLLLGQEDGLAGSVIYEAYDPSSLPGDFNADGSVDAADYTVWRDNLGQSDSALNGNGTGDASGLVVPEDYSLWRASYGASSSQASGDLAGSNVPEPATMMLGLLLALAQCTAQQRKRA